MTVTTSPSERVQQARPLTAELNLHLPPAYFASRTTTEPYEDALVPFLAAGEGPLGVYVNVPLCEERCRFCMYFAGVVDGGGERAEDCVLGLEELLGRLADAGPRSAAALYIGGGTPTVLTPRQIRRLAAAIDAALPVEQRGQRTIECSPGTATPERLEAIIASGFNRVSFGVQSFDHGVLAASGRSHASPERVARLVHDLLDAGIDEINIDLMVGLDGSSTATLVDDARRLAATGVPTFSIYRYRPARADELQARGGMDRHVSRCSGAVLAAAAGVEPDGYLMQGAPDAEHVRFARQPSPFDEAQSYQTRYRVDLRNSVMGLGVGARSMLRDEQYIYCGHRSDERYRLTDRTVEVEYCDEADRLSAAVVNEFARSGRVDLATIGSSCGLDAATHFSEEVAYLVDLGALTVEGTTAVITPAHRDEWPYLDKLFYPPAWLQRLSRQRVRIR